MSPLSRRSSSFSFACIVTMTAVLTLTAATASNKNKTRNLMSLITCRRAEAVSCSRRRLGASLTSGVRMRRTTSNPRTSMMTCTPYTPSKSYRSPAILTKGAERIMLVVIAKAFKATAFINRRSGTSSGINACRTGCPKAWATPERTDRIRTHG